MRPSEGTDQRGSRRNVVADIALTLAAAGFGALALADRWADSSSALRVFMIAGGAMGLTALWRRREHPTAVALFCIVVSTAAPAAAGAAIVAMFSAALYAARRGVQAVVAAALAGTLITPAIYPSDTSYLVGLALGAAFVAAIVGWGLFVRARRELVQSLRERAQRLEDEQQLKVAQARQAERRRIASEMHDVLAHRVSLLSVHAGALEFRPDASPDEIAETTAVIRDSAHSVLEELREVIGVLRDDQEPDAVAPPQPTLTQLPPLVEESRAAGTDVALNIDVPVDAEPPTLIARTAYRVVQEGLTNARKHAPDAQVEVMVAGSPGETLAVSVLSRNATAVKSDVPGWGAGLVGLRERVTLAGGSLEHGPHGAGTFLLRAELPWPT
jgi:signal transduction histidine kinase